MKVGDLVRWSPYMIKSKAIVGIITEKYKTGWFHVSWVTEGTVESTREPAIHLELVNEGR